MCVILNVSSITNTVGARLLEKYVVPDAAYNRRGARDRCLEGTRKLWISNIMDRACGDADRPICWFYGPAGFGTVAERCAEAGTLAASFFFKQGAGGRARIDGLIPTLCYQLTLSIPDTKLQIQTALQNDPIIPQQSLEDQLQKLVTNPVLSLAQPTRRMVVIDALDECDNNA